MPGIGPLAFAYLLPALALAIIALVLPTRWGTRTTATIVGVTWLTAVVTFETRGRRPEHRRRGGHPSGRDSDRVGRRHPRPQDS